MLFIKINTRYLLVVLIGFLIGSSFYSINPFLITGLVVCTSISLINKKTLFGMAIFLPMLTGIIVNFFGLYLLNYVDELYISIISILILVNLQLGDKKSTQGYNSTPRILSLIILFTAIVFVSAIVNKSSPYAFFYFFTTHIKVFILVLGIFFVLDEKETDFLFRTLFYIGILQAIIAITQFFTFGRGNLLVGHEISIRIDSATGTLGNDASHLLGHYMVVLCILTINLFFCTKRKKWLVMFFIFLFTFVLTFAEQDYIFLAIFAIVFFVFNKKIKIWKKGVVITCGVALIFIIGNLDSDFFRRYKEYFQNPKEIYYTNKVQGVIIASKIMNEDIPSLLIGKGPGSFCSSAAARVGGTLFKKYIGNFLNFSGSLDFFWSSILTLLVETGLLGFSVFMCILIKLISLIYGLVSVEKNDFTKAILMSSLWCIFYIIFLMFIFNVFENANIMFPFGLLIAYSLKLGLAKKYG